MVLDAAHSQKDAVLQIRYVVFFALCNQPVSLNINHLKMYGLKTEFFLKLNQQNCVPLILNIFVKLPVLAPSNFMIFMSFCEQAGGYNTFNRGS